MWAIGSRIESGFRGRDDGVEDQRLGCRGFERRRP